MNHPGTAPPWRVPRSPRRLMLAVLLLHGAALIGLQWASRPVRSTAVPPQRLLLRWIAQPPPSPPEAARERDPRPRSERPPERPPLAPPPVRREPTRPDLTTPLRPPQAPQTRQAITVAPPRPSEPAASHPPPLRLELPRPGRVAPGQAPEGAPSPAGQALRDPRSNSSIARGNPVERALDAGPTAVAEEDRGDGRRRYRIGRDCADTRESRAAGLDPFSASTRPVPRLAESCR
ncbi:hypothetical protein [Sphaerotilus microaerophilus]|uniref:Uncharacterized protein n=1 Tax=Sphaerotilus microaerophilus TaxID=2914710 RepID=A0ABM7YLN0_9BURK|nr:hypothetical protein [Sphaerotilus sp. FB-5]BDI05354.1 hypothetical protein CATMQ487_23240 [Sphaerotilus sp. FB-5]